MFMEFAPSDVKFLIKDKSLITRMPLLWLNLE